MLAANWGTGNATWAMGDFNGDQMVNDKDAAILAARGDRIDGHGAKAQFRQQLHRRIRTAVKTVVHCLPKLFQWRGGVCIHPPTVEQFRELRQF